MLVAAAAASRAAAAGFIAAAGRAAVIAGLVAAAVAGLTTVGVGTIIVAPSFASRRQHNFATALVAVRLHPFPLESFCRLGAGRQWNSGYQHERYCCDKRCFHPVSSCRDQPHPQTWAYHPKTRFPLK